MDFQEAYHKAETWADMEKVLDTLSDNAQIELMNSLQIVKNMTGLDMRQDFMLGLLKSMVKHKLSE
jgi:hypothetical protein